MKSKRVARQIGLSGFEREYAGLLRQWQNNAAAIAQDEPDPHFRYYLRAWYAAFEETLSAMQNGADVQIRVYSTGQLPLMDFDTTDSAYGEVE